MADATFRFYGELNDFLAPARQGRAFACRCARAATAKHMIEALGVPHTEVALLLVEGEAAELGRILRDGERVAAYPGFTGLALGPLELAKTPPGRPRFVADAHLGGLARLLRMAGFDTLYENNFEDEHIADLSVRQARIVLTRDRALLMRRMVAHGCYIRAIKAPEQLLEVKQRLGLAAAMQPFSLCLKCNAPLHAAGLAQVAERLPPAVRTAHTEFQVCDVCQGVFWKGSHWRRMCAVLAGAACCRE